MSTKTFDERMADMKAARGQQHGVRLYHANINVLDQSTSRTR